MTQAELTREDLRRALLDWFKTSARVLPWRTQRTPYRVWIAEVMLQQTQVETVRHYYPRFIARFPTIQTLAEAPLEDVLKQWEGLGYYSRARSLHRAAQEIIAKYNGKIPADPQTLRTLPGIGEYTAGAIASIAFGISIPAVDGNVRRVISRLKAATLSNTEVTATVQHLLPHDAAGEFNEALMELGATICRPQSPRCDICPWNNHCQAYAAGEPTAYPAPRPRKPLPHYEVAAAITVREDSRILVAQRRHDDMLGGMWEFPGGKQEPGETLPQALIRELHEELGIEVIVKEELLQVRHAYTHFRITLHAFITHLVEGEPRCIECASFRWATIQEIRSLPMAVTDRKIAKAVEKWLPSYTNGGKSG